MTEHFYNSFSKLKKKLRGEFRSDSVSDNKKMLGPHLLTKTGRKQNRKICQHFAKIAFFGYKTEIATF